MSFNRAYFATLIWAIFPQAKAGHSTKSPACTRTEHLPKLPRECRFMNALKASSGFCATLRVILKSTIRTLERVIWKSCDCRQMRQNDFIVQNKFLLRLVPTLLAYWIKKVHHGDRCGLAIWCKWWLVYNIPYTSRRCGHTLWLLVIAVSQLCTPICFDKEKRLFSWCHWRITS